MSRHTETGVGKGNSRAFLGVSVRGFGPVDEAGYVSRLIEMCYLEIERQSFMIDRIRYARDKAMKSGMLSKVQAEEVRLELEWRVKEREDARVKRWWLRQNLFDWRWKARQLNKKYPRLERDGHPVGFGTKYANPHQPQKPKVPADLERGVMQYRFHLFGHPELLQSAVAELRGKHLSADGPAQYSHAEVLIDAANRLETGCKQIPTWARKGDLQSL